MKVTEQKVVSVLNKLSKELSNNAIYEEHPDYPKVRAFRLTFNSFLRSDGEPISFWMSSKEGVGYNLSDAGQFVRRQPDLNLSILAEVVGDYGCSLMENLSIMETSHRADSVRVLSLLQCLVVIEGITRVWRRQGVKRGTSSTGSEGKGQTDSQ